MLTVSPQSIISDSPIQSSITAPEFYYNDAHAEAAKVENMNAAEQRFVECSQIM